MKLNVHFTAEKGDGAFQYVTVFDARYLTTDDALKDLCTARWGVPASCIMVAPERTNSILVSIEPPSAPLPLRQDMMLPTFRSVEGYMTALLCRPHLCLACLPICMTSWWADCLETWYNRFTKYTAEDLAHNRIDAGCGVLPEDHIITHMRQRACAGPSVEHLAVIVCERHMEGVGYGPACTRLVLSLGSFGFRF